MSIPGSIGKDLGNGVYEYKCQFCGAKYVSPYPKGGFDICPKCSETKEGRTYVKIRNRYNYLQEKADWYTNRAAEVYGKYNDSLRAAHLAINGNDPFKDDNANG